MLVGIIDRILFSCGVLLFLQLPAFIDQYTHRLGGFEQALSQQVADFQNIADKNFSGDVEQLIDTFSKSQMPSVRETAVNIKKQRQLQQTINEDLKVLQTAGLSKRIVYVISHFRYFLAEETVRFFKPSIPLDGIAFLYALLGGFLFSFLFFILIRLPIKWLFSKKNSQQQIQPV